MNTLALSKQFWLSPLLISRTLEHLWGNQILRWNVSARRNAQNLHLMGRRPILVSYILNSYNAAKFCGERSLWDKKKKWRVYIAVLGNKERWEGKYDVKGAYILWKLPTTACEGAVRHLRSACTGQSSGIITVYNAKGWGWCFEVTISPVTQISS